MFRATARNGEAWTGDSPSRTAKQWIGASFFFKRNIEDLKLATYLFRRARRRLTRPPASQAGLYALLPQQISDIVEASGTERLGVLEAQELPN